MDIMTHRGFNTKAQNGKDKKLEPRSMDEESAYKNAAEVLTMIRDGTLQAVDLKEKDRRPVVAYLRLEGYSKEEMSRLFEVPVKTIKKDLNVLSEDRTKVIKGLNLLEVAGRLNQIAQHLARKARREGSFGTAWKIEKELIESLQSMGFVYRAPKTLGIASLHANVSEGNLMLNEKIGGEKDLVVDALGSILSALGGGEKKVKIGYDQKKESPGSDEIIEIGGS